MTTTPSGEELLRSAIDDPEGALPELRSMADEARSSGDRGRLAEVCLATTQAALGLGLIEAATESVEEGIAAAQQASLDRVEFSLRRLRVGVLSESGRFPDALVELDHLERVARDDELGLVRFTRATVLLVSDRMEEARRTFDAALPILRAAGDDRRVAMALNNRANTDLAAGRLDEAESALREAADAFARIGADFQRRTTTIHLATLLARRGQLSEALDSLEAVRVDDPAFQFDEAAVLIDAHLLDEAIDVLGRAAAGFERQGQRSYAAGALVRESQIHLQRGDDDRAAATAERALELLDDDAGQSVEASIVLLSSGTPDDSLTGRLADLDRAGRLDSADAIRVRVAERLVAEGRSELAGRLAAPVAGRPPGGLRSSIRRHLAIAIVAVAEGRTGAARRSVASGLSLLARHQAALGAVDLRAEAQGHGEALAALGLRLASHRRAIDLLLTSERSRAGTSRLPRPPVTDDPELSALLARLRSAQRRHDDHDPLDDARGRVRREIRSLERMVATRRRTRPGAAGRPTTVDERRLRAASHRAALVSFVDVDGELVRLDLIDGQCRRRDLGPVDELGAHIDGALRSLARLADRRLRPAMVDARRRSFEQDTEVLSGRLLAGLDTEHPLVIVPTGRLHTIPWAAMGPLRTRPFVLAASVTGWLDAEERSSARQASGVCAVAGPALDEADDEVATVAAITADAAVLRGAEAGGARVADAMRGVRVAHLAAHGRFRVDNPLLSGVELCDGVLTVHDLEPSAPTPPVVVLSACDLARAVVRPGDELLGLAAGLFALGTDSFVAAVVPVPDSSTRALMEAFHRRVPSESLAAALAGARAELLDGDPAPRALVAAMAFCVIGAGLAAP